MFMFSSRLRKDSIRLATFGFYSTNDKRGSNRAGVDKPVAVVLTSHLRARDMKRRVEGNVKTRTRQSTGSYPPLADQN
jgi:hypothetical protein